MGVYIFKEGIAAFTPAEELTTDLGTAVHDGSPVTVVQTVDLAALLDLYDALVEFVRPYSSIDPEADALISRAEIRR